MHDARSELPDLRMIQHLGPIVAPVPYRRIGRHHLHLAGVVGMKQIERRPRIATLGNAQPTVIVSGVQNERETIVDGGDELVGLSSDDCEGLEAGTIRPLP
jgi:hypothetical protein